MTVDISDQSNMAGCGDHDGDGSGASNKQIQYFILSLGTDHP